jgi:serine protease Do
VVTSVTPFGPADLAGLRKGDVVLRVGNRQVQTQADLRSELENLSGGSKMTMNVALSSRTRSLTVTMGYPPRDGAKLRDSAN